MEMIEVIETLSAEETTERLRSLGMRISPEKIRLGIQQGVYPFGDCVIKGKSPNCCIYKRLLDQWIAERSTMKVAEAL